MEWLEQVANWRLWAAETKKGPHPPYKIKEEGGKFFVYNSLGMKKNNKGYKTRKEAEALQRALYSALPPSMKNNGGK